MEILKSLRVRKATNELGTRAYEQLVGGGSLLIMIDKRIAGNFNLEDLQDDRGQTSFKPVAEVLEANPGSNVRFTIINSERRLVASYIGRIKNVPS